MKKLRVAMIAPPWLSIPPKGYGGIENVVAALVRNLRGLDVSVELFTVGDSTITVDEKHWLYEKGQYDIIHKPYYDAAPILIAHICAALNTIRKDGGFDIIHDHNPYIGPAMMAYADDSLPPILHTLHGPPFSTPDQLALGIPDNLPMWRQLSKSKRVHYVNISKAANKGAPKEFDCGVLAPVHNGIEVTDIPYQDTKSDYFMTLARFHPNKGQSLAIKACLADGYSLRMAGLVADIANPKKVMMELANPTSIYRSLIDFRYFSDEIFPLLDDSLIRYVGDLENEAKYKMLGEARALLFPIQWDEPFGMAVIEALACGTPVVAMARGAMPELIRHGYNGYLANSYQEFRQYMSRVDEIDPANCRASAESNFSAHKMAQGYLDRYHEIIRKSSE